MELKPKSSFFIIIRTFNVINATILGKIGTLNCPNRFTNNRSLCYVVAICVFFFFHHQFNLVWGSVLTSSGFSPLPIAVVGIELWSSLPNSAPITTESTNDCRLVVVICVLEHTNFDSNGFSLKKKRQQCLHKRFSLIKPT
jgi:hypothetical protein